MRPATLSPGSLAQVDPEVQHEAQRLVEVFAENGAKPLALPVGGTSVVVPESLSRVLLDIIANLASGSAVGVYALPDELTTTTTAQQIGVSRPTLMKMIRNGEIDAYKVGTHTRLKRTVVADYLDARAERRAGALEQLLQDGEDYPN